MRNLVYFLATTDDASKVGKMKCSDGDDVCPRGGIMLAARIINGIDEFISEVSPVVLGYGFPVFGQVVGPRRLTMIDQRIHENGFALPRYRQVASEPGHE